MDVKKFSSIPQANPSTSRFAKSSIPHSNLRLNLNKYLNQTLLPNLGRALNLCDGGEGNKR